MRKIVFIGAGSGFGQRLSSDILSYPEMQDCHLALVDIDERHLQGVEDCVRRVIDFHQLPATVEATTDREAVLADADYVVISVAIGGPAYDGVPYYHEITIPAKYGIFQEVGDTVGPGGVFRTLRSAPEMIRLAQDVARLCPQAWVLNYTNPMAMLTWLMSEVAPIRLVGLCHSVQGTAHQLAGYMGVPADELRTWVAGLNHMAWFLELKRDGQDLYPRLREVMDDEETWQKDPVRFEILRHFDYFVTESTRHMSEYVPYFRKSREQMERFGLILREPGEVSSDRRWEWLQDIRQQLMEKEDHQLKPSGEYAAHIIHAIETNQPFRFNGNVRNEGLIGNLPPECCVEVPCLVDGTGVRPCHVGDLPAHLAALNMSNVAVQKLTVAACLERSREQAYYATALDPLTAGQCDLDQIRAMFDELWEADRPWLQDYPD
jgi:alpha-galactosidase